MILSRLSILNYKNIAEATLDLSPKLNAFIGNNGVGKTNLLDAVYFLSFCRSANAVLDSQLLRHEEPFMMLEGSYVCDVSSAEEGLMQVSCGMKRGQKKHFRRDKKEYRRLSEHIGLIPLVMVSPGDTLLIEGGSEERRHLMDIVISQKDRPYIDLLNRYGKALQQRNSLLKQEDGMPDEALLSLLEEQMAYYGGQVYERRKAFVEELTPLFDRFYSTISDGREHVSLGYTSHCQREGGLLEVIRRDRRKDLAVGYSLHGVHRDDLVILIDGHPMRREGSQGQNKTFVIALKLAQFELLRMFSGGRVTPILLLDDIFDKLDARRVEKIVDLVSGPDFGQIFITDTNRDHLDQILRRSPAPHKLFVVEGGHFEEQTT